SFAARQRSSAASFASERATSRPASRRSRRRSATRRTWSSARKSITSSVARTVAAERKGSCVKQSARCSTRSCPRHSPPVVGHVYRYLGMTVGCIDDTEPGTPDRRTAYLNDITYGTNNEFGFDYLRDNMVVSTEQKVQRQHTFAIVDEVDSVLVDEARTPLIISGPVGNDNDPMYFQYNSGVERLVRRQTELVNSLVGEAERDLEKGDTASGAIKLYKAQLGSP